MQEKSCRLLLASSLESNLARCWAFQRFFFCIFLKAIASKLFFSANFILFAVDCPHPTCNDHGFCVQGQCSCHRGWKGRDCSETDEAALACLPDCSDHGKFDVQSSKCICDAGWAGNDCSAGKLCPSTACTAWSWWPRHAAEWNYLRFITWKRKTYMQPSTVTITSSTTEKIS